MIIAFDIDGCLIDKNDKPRKEVIALLKALSKENRVIIWTGSGIDYAERRVRELKLGQYIDFFTVKTNPHFKPDIAIDDNDVKLGKYNIKI